MITYNDEITILTDRWNRLAVLIDRQSNMAFGPVIQGIFAEGIAIDFLNWYYSKNGKISLSSLPDHRQQLWYDDYLKR